MKEKLEQLKTELREFIELSKTITPRNWEQGKSRDNKRLFLGPFELDFDDVDRGEQLCNAAFIARARNISPAMAECLLGVVEWLDLYAVPTQEADKQLQQILNIWEASK